MELTIQGLKEVFLEQDYVCDDEIILPVFLAIKLGKPLLITGAPGVGKTEIAKVLSAVFQTELIRLQCYEGLDEHKALYEWNYQKQLLKIQLTKDSDQEFREHDLFHRDYLLERPLLKAILADRVPVLLIDEIDKTDEEFEAFLFELLSDFQVSIPELGTLTAKQRPIVVLTSNGERELSDGLKRRCIFLYIDYPTIEKELLIIKRKLPGINEKMALDIAHVLYHLRHHFEFKKQPSIAETLDWARALLLLEVDTLDSYWIDRTINLLLKDKEDIDTFHREMGAAGLIQHVSELKKSRKLTG